MKYEKPELEVIRMEYNIYMALSSDDENQEGDGEKIGF